MESQLGERIRPYPPAPTACIRQAAAGQCCGEVTLAAEACIAGYSLYFLPLANNSGVPISSLSWSKSNISPRIGSVVPCAASEA